MTRTFKVGDRVRVYDGSKSADGCVKFVFSSGLLTVTFDCVKPGDERFIGREYHPKQCRKFVEKKNRRILIEYYKTDGWRIIGPIPIPKEPGEIIEFIEVKRKERG